MDIHYRIVRFLGVWRCTIIYQFSINITLLLKESLQLDDRD